MVEEKNYKNSLTHKLRFLPMLSLFNFIDMAHKNELKDVAPKKRVAMFAGHVGYALISTIAVGMYTGGVLETGKFSIPEQNKVEQERKLEKQLFDEKFNLLFSTKGLADLDKDDLELSEIEEAYKRMGIELSYGISPDYIYSPNITIELPKPTIEQLNKAIMSYKE